MHVLNVNLFLFRTKAEPHLFYVPAKHNAATEKLFDVRQQEFEEWRTLRRAELTRYEQQLQEEALRVPESARWSADTSKSTGPPEPAPRAEPEVGKMDVDEGNPEVLVSVERGERGTEDAEGIDEHADGPNGNGGEDKESRKEPKVQSKSERLSKIHDSDEDEEGYDPSDLDKLLVGDDEL